MTRDKKDPFSLHKGAAGVTLTLLLAGALAGCGGQAAEKEKTDPVGETVTEEPVEAESEPKEQETGIEAITEEAMVASIVDGDTIVINGENGEETIRLAEIDAPDKNLPDGTPDEQFGFKANEYAKMKLEGAAILLERAEKQDDKEGRALGYIWLKAGGDHLNYNKMMIQDGVARVEEGANDKYLEEFRAAEDEAKSKKEDIWSIDGYVTEDGFDASLVQ